MWPFSSRVPCIVCCDLWENGSAPIFRTRAGYPPGRKRRGFESRARQEGAKIVPEIMEKAKAKGVETWPEGWGGWVGIGGGYGCVWVGGWVCGCVRKWGWGGVGGGFFLRCPYLETGTRIRLEAPGN